MEGRGFAAAEKAPVLGLFRPARDGALCFESARRVAEAGGTELFVNAGPRDDYPAPSGAHLKAGFEVRRRGVLYRPASRETHRPARQDHPAKLGQWRGRSREACN